MFCSTLLYVHSSFAIILMGKGELVALLALSCFVLLVSSDCCVALHRGSMGFSAICDCGFFLIILSLFYLKNHLGFNDEESKCDNKKLF